MRAFALVLVAGCAMYGAPPVPLHRVPQTKPPAGSADDQARVIYREESETDFHRETRGIVVQRSVADDRVHAGDNASVAATKQSGAAQATLLVESIGHYADALRADPYDAS